MIRIVWVQKLKLWIWSLPSSHHYFHLRTLENVFFLIVKVKFYFKYLGLIEGHLSWNKLSCLFEDVCKAPNVLFWRNLRLGYQNCAFTSFSEIKAIFKSPIIAQNKSKKTLSNHILLHLCALFLTLRQRYPRWFQWCYRSSKIDNVPRRTSLRAKGENRIAGTP